MGERRKIYTASVALLFCLFLNTPAPAFAQSGQVATLEWTLPTSHTDGSPLSPSTDLHATEGIRIYHCQVQPCDLNGGNARLAQVAPGTNTMAAVPDLPYSQNLFFVTAVHVNGNESVMSNVALRDVPDTRRPEAPTLIDVLLSNVLMCQNGTAPAELADFCAYYAERAAGFSPGPT